MNEVSSEEFISELLTTISNLIAENNILKIKLKKAYLEIEEKD